MEIASAMPGAARAIRASAAGAILAAMLGGCIMLPPIPFAEHREMPAVSAHVPADILAGPAELLVLSHRKASNRANLFSRKFDQTSAVEARLIRGGDFAAFSQGLRISREQGVHLVGVVGCLQLGMPCKGFAERQVNAHEWLERLCVVSADGRAIALLPVLQGAAATLTTAQETLHSARRDAIVQSLRGPDAAPFSRIDGPCALDETSDWPERTRRLAIEFLARLPDTPIPADTRVEALMRRAALASGGDALLLATGAWRGEEAANRPVFLSAADLAEFKALVPALDRHAAVAAFFTEHHTHYRRGTRSLQSLDIRHLCVIGSDGDIRYWSEGQSWRSLAESASVEQWRRDALRVLRSERGARSGDCMPDRPRSWSDAQLQAVVEFVSALKPPNGTPVQLP